MANQPPTLAESIYPKQNPAPTQKAAPTVSPAAKALFGKSSRVPFYSTNGVSPLGGQAIRRPVRK
jgi:hypothetical protein